MDDLLQTLHQVAPDLATALGIVDAQLSAAQDSMRVVFPEHLGEAAERVARLRQRRQELLQEARAALAAAGIGAEQTTTSVQATAPTFPEWLRRKVDDLCAQYHRAPTESERQGISDEILKVEGAIVTERTLKEKPEAQPSGDVRGAFC